MTIPILVKTFGQPLIVDTGSGFITVSGGAATGAIIGDVSPIPIDAIVASTGALVVGADQEVLDLATGGPGIDVSGFGIPAETGPTVDPRDAPHNAVADGVTDDRAALISAWGALPAGGGVLDLTGAMFAVAENTSGQFQNKDNITIKGDGAGSGIRVVGNPTQTNRFRSALEFDNCDNMVIRDIEVDCGNERLGAIRPASYDGLYIVSCWLHNAGSDTGLQSGVKPLAFIKGGGIEIDTNIIGCLVEDSLGDAGPDSGTRGIWLSTEGSTGGLIEQCYVRDCGHSGLAIHAETPTQTVVRRCTFINNAGAGAKPEKPDGRPASFDPGFDLQLYELNYMSGNGFTGCQIEALGVLFQNNLIENQARGITTFDDFRRVTIKENVYNNISNYGLYIDAPASKPDKTNLFFQNNTINGNTSGDLMEDGIHFFNDFSGAGTFANGDPIQVTDNKITGAQNNNVKTTTDLVNYFNFTNTNNGPSGAGAPNQLIRSA
jgi:hypothetical protein